MQRPRGVKEQCVCSKEFAVRSYGRNGTETQGRGPFKQEGAANDICKQRV